MGIWLSTGFLRRTSKLTSSCSSRTCKCGIAAVMVEAWKAWKAYKILNPDAKLYLFDLRGYGQMPVRQTTDDVFLIAGWSEKVFEILDAIEGGESALEHIQQIEL